MLTTMVVALMARLEDARREEGQGLVEYALILGIVAVLAVATLGLIGGHVNDVFTTIEGLF